jgi:cytochrome d ubiquinol oxidase subunit I
MQHPVGYKLAANHTLVLTSLRAVLTNPYVPWQFLHTIIASMVTGAMILVALSSYYLLAKKNNNFARVSMTVGLISGLIFALTLAYPTGSKNGEQVVKYNPIKLAAMEGQFKSEAGAPLSIVGIPDTAHGKLLDAVEVPGLLSYLAYGAFAAPVRGLNSFPVQDQPPIEVTYYAYHIMITLGGAFIGVLGLGVLLWLKGWIWKANWYHWIAMLAFPFPYIANEAGWVVACVGRQPWIVYGLMRTSAATSTNVATGEVVFTLIGYVGLYVLLGFLFTYLVMKIISEGPDDSSKLAIEPKLDKSDENMRFAA